MIDRRFVTLFLITFAVFSFSGLLWWQFFYIPDQSQDQDEVIDQDVPTSGAYEEIELVLPVQALLKRGVNSANISMVKRAFINQWIYFNEQELIKLIVYAQGATSFEELKKAFETGIEKEPKNGAISFVNGSLKAVQKDEKLLGYVNQSLREGLTSQLHTLRGQMMEVEKGSKEYRKLKIEYKKALDSWIDEKFGELLDELIMQI